MNSVAKALRTRITSARQAVNEGRFEDARALCRSVFEDDPGNLAALHTYVSATRMRPDDPVFERLMRFADAPGLPPDARSRVHFMLGKALDDMGRVEAAFDVFVTANALKPVHFDAAGKARFAARLIATVAKAPALALPPAPPRMVFVLGMPRSGSTLLAQMLGAHPRITSLGEVEAMAPALTFLRGHQVRLPDFIAGMDLEVLATARARYLQDIPLKARESGDVLIDKMPENYWLAWAIPMLFPDARIVHMRRDRRAVFWSCFRNDFGHGHEYSYDWAALTTQYETQERLVAAWKARAPRAWHDISLESLSTAPQSTLLPLLDALGLSWDDACLSPERTRGPVRTLSKWQVRHGITSEISEGWRAYLPMMRARWGVE